MHWVNGVNGILVPVMGDMGEDIAELLTTFTEMYMEIMVPFWEMMKPVLKGMAWLYNYKLGYIAQDIKDMVNVIKVISGSLEIGFGQTITAIGSLIEGVGSLVKRFTHSNYLENIGQNIHESGLKMIDSGIDNAVSGQIGLLRLDTNKKTDTTDTSSTNVVLPERTASTGMNLDGSVNVDTTYGSGNQNNYGSYLNMAKRGCGPVALADAVSRRTGTSVDPRMLATSMAASGNYSTKRGTSVSNYINTASAMGVGYTVGGVTSSSLSKASPNNPITVVGSGTGYGTSRGNTHYVNVIGAKNGIAYTSNPLTGRIESRSVSDIASGAVVGLYGSGNIADALPDSVSDLFDELKEKASGILSLFNFEDDIETATKKAELEATYKNIKSKLSDEELKEVETEAYKQFMAKNPRQEKESASSYLKRWNKHKLEYIVDIGSQKALEKTQKLYGDIGDNAAENTAQMYGSWDSITGKFLGGAANIASQLLSALQLDTAGSSYGISSGGSGSVLSVLPAVIRAYEAVGVVGNKGDYNQGGRTHQLTINGQSLTERPDCTGFVDSVIDAMGYDSGKMRSADFQSASGIKDKSGNISSDWTFYDNPRLSDFQPGDIGITYKGDDHHGEVFAANSNNKMYGVSYGWEGGMKKALDAVKLMDSNGLTIGDALVQAGSTINGHGYYTRLLRHIAGSLGSDTTGGSSGGGSVSGGTTEQQIWAYMTQVLGFTPQGAAGVMGNMQHESGLRPNNLEDIFNSRIGMSDEQYTAAVDNNSYSRAKFISDHTKAGCGAGYGLPQFTAAELKSTLYDLAKSGGKSIADVGVQLDAIAKTVNSDLVEKLKTTGNVTEASNLWLTKYEKPANMEAQKSKRAAAAQTYYDKYANWDGSGVSVTGGSSYGGSSGTAGQIGANVRNLLTKGSLNLGTNTAIQAAFDAATAGLQVMTNPLGAATKLAFSDNTKNVISTAIETGTGVKNSVANGIRDLISNKITTAGKVVSTWWNGAKQGLNELTTGATNVFNEISEISEDGIKQTLTDIGSAAYESGTGFLGSVFDTAGNEFQVLYDGFSNDVQIVKGTAEDVASQISNGIGNIVGSLIGTYETGDTTEGSKLKNYLNGKYGKTSFLTDSAESLLGLFAKEIANSSGLFNQQTSSYGGYSSLVDDSYSDEETSSTIVPGTTDSDYYTAHDEAVTATMKANWKATLDEGRKEWYSRTRNGKAPENWWNTYIKNKRMADYYRTEYPYATLGEAFSKWYQSKWYTNKNNTSSTVVDTSTTSSTTSSSSGSSTTTTTVDTSVYDYIKSVKELENFLSQNGNKKKYKNDTLFWNTMSENIPSWTSTTKDIVLSSIKGSGNVPMFTPIYGNGDIPPIDMNAVNAAIGNDYEEQPSVVNQYIVNTPTDTSTNTDWITKLEDITFNVRAQRVEELLEEISGKLDNIKSGGGSTVIANPQPVDETTNAIPQQVTRLARG